MNYCKAELEAQVDDRIETKLSAPDGGASRCDRGRLTGVSGAHTESFSFDSNGNRNSTVRETL